MRSWSGGRWLLPVVLLALVAHAETLEYWFVASDTLPLVATSRVTDPAGFVALFTQPLMAGSDFTTTALFYRPVSTLTYAIDYALWGLNPAGYHLTNLLLHTAAAALVAVCTVQITRRRAVGVLAGALFAIHPVTAEVVPVTARRQDTLLTIFVLLSLVLFVRWYRATAPAERFPWRWASHRPLGGALVAYALALGAKETAVVVPVMATVWVLLHRESDRPRQLFRTLFGTVGPFAAVTLTYLAVRVAVLDGLGGYRVPTSATLLDRSLFGVKYLLWLVYPQNAILGLPSLRAAGTPSLVVGVAGVLLVGALVVMALLRQGYFHRGRFRRLRALSPVASVVGFAAIPLVLAGESLGAVALPAIENPLGGYLVGVLFVGACLAGLATALFAGGVPIGGNRRRQLAFFACWVLVPLSLLVTRGFVTSKPLTFGFGMRNGYLAAAPAMAALALVVVPSLRRVLAALRDALTDERNSAPNAGDMACIAAIGLLLFPVLGASPLLYAGDGWRSAGDLNERSLSGLDDALDGVSGDKPIYVVNFPQGFDNSHQPTPHAQSVTPLRPYSVEAWLELDGMRDPQVRFVRSATVSEIPELAFRTEERERLTAVWVERAVNDTRLSRTASARPGVTNVPSRAAVVN
ncbi:hypothetical protein [Halococcus sediminicola]|uniref:hypothetical protein n=1 Tax=Halococcus sediminicola TaxID=1264579 RepID=UPI0006792E9B|nr:hypothetical protein [Halococcus sediminicola]